MKIKVTRNDTHIDVSLLTASLELDLAVRFDSLSDAVDFAELWGDWIGCDDIEVVAAMVPQPLGAAA